MDPRIVAPLVLLSCTAGERKAANFQLDVVGASLLDTDRVRVCIGDTKVHETTVGHGRIAIGGLSSGEAANITIDGITGTAQGGHTQPISLDLNMPWAEVPWEICQGCAPCSIEKRQADTGENTEQLLAIRFLD